MVSRALVVVLAAGLGLATSGCDQLKQKFAHEPTGQVIATVNGEEITALELRNEMNGFKATDPKLAKLAQDQALQQIIIRNLLAQRARDQKLDKIPVFTLQVRRGERTLLAQLYESKLFGDVAPPTRREAENYVADHPEKFAKRRIMILDRVITPKGPVTQDKIPGIKSLEALKALLDSQSAAYQQTVAVVDTLDADPETVRGIDALAPGEVFIFDQRNVLVFNRVIDVREAPFNGELAIDYATDQLRRLQAQDFVQNSILGMRRAAESTITYAKGFKPDNPDFGVAPLSGAPGAPAPAQQSSSGGLGTKAGPPSAPSKP
jgi:EpsD family peptidyl-prolyl cis-trans isomerase